MTRLTPTLPTHLPGVRPVRYDRSRATVGIVHLGIGAFHRAHQAAYIDDVLALGQSDWMIRGASLRSPTVAEQLNPQSGLYTIQVRDSARTEVQLVGSVRDVLIGRNDPQGLIRAMADPAVRIVSLTITEKGYKLEPGSGALMDSDPEIRADLANPEMPVTAIGYLFAALRNRYHAGLKPFTVLSCDNLPHNGKRTRDAVVSYAEQLDPVIADWLSGDGAFPSTMVDRIVPATQPQDIDALEGLIGVRDFGMVKTEPFTQWVIEDTFADGRPDFAAVGVQMTDAVPLWEAAKLRLLNGAHSSLAYLGALSGKSFMHECMAEPVLRSFVEGFWDEAASTLTPPHGLDIAAYRSNLRQRFANSALNHSTRQIAMDGSQKLPQRLLATAQDRLARGQSINCLALGIAGWMRWQLGQTDAGDRYRVEDPLADRLTRLAADSEGHPGRLIDALLSVREVFDRDLAADPRFAAALLPPVARMLSDGTMAAIRQTLQTTGALA